jgi:hypothetical protein
VNNKKGKRQEKPFVSTNHLARLAKSEGLNQKELQSNTDSSGGFSSDKGSYSSGMLRRSSNGPIPCSQNDAFLLEQRIPSFSITNDFHSDDYLQAVIATLLKYILIDIRSYTGSRVGQTR